MINNEGLELIKKCEGCILTVYLDPVGVKTVGYGHTGADVNKLKVGTPISKETAEKWLLADIEKAEYQVKLYDQYIWNENEYAALVSFAFNIGNIKGLTSYGTRTREQIRAKIPEYCYAGGNKLEGLKRRRLEELALFNKPVTVRTMVPNYQVGKSYTVEASALAVRVSPSLNAKLVPWDNLTLMGQHCTKGKTSYFKNGTRITVQDKLVDSDGNVWVKCPSGWLCAYLLAKDKIYVS